MIETISNYSSFNVTDATPLPFEVSVPYFFENDHIHVYELDGDETGALLTENTHYTLTGAGEESGGTLTLTTRMQTGNSILVILNEPDPTQLTDYIRNGKFDSQAHEDALDKGRMVDQSVEGRLNRSLRVPGYERVALQLMGMNARKEKILGFDASGQPYFPATVQELIDAINSNLPGDITVSQTPSILTAVAATDDNALDITWDTADVAEWLVFQLYPEGEKDKSKIHWVQGADGSTRLIGEFGAADYEVYAWGKNDPGTYSPRVTVGGAPITLGLPAPAGVAVDVATAQELEVTFTPIADMWTWVQLQEVGTERYLSDWVLPNNGTLRFKKLDPAFYRVRLLHQHETSKQHSAATYADNDANDGTGPGFEVTVAAVVDPAGVSASVTGKTITVSKTADAVNWSYIQVYRNLTDEIYTSGWLLPGETDWSVVVENAGEYSGRIYHKNDVTGILSNEVTFTVGTVSATSVPAPSGYTINVATAGEFTLAYTPPAGYWTYAQIWRQGGTNAELRDVWIHEYNTGYTWSGLPAGDYGIRLINAQQNTPYQSDWVIDTNTGAYYTLAGATKPGDDATKPADPVISSVVPSAGQVVVTMANNTNTWTFVQLFKSGISNAAYEMWLEPGVTVATFRSVADGSYQVTAYRQTAGTGVWAENPASDNNGGALYTVTSSAPTAPNITGNITVATNNRIGVQWTTESTAWTLVQIKSVGSEAWEEEKWVKPGTQAALFVEVPPGFWTIHAFHLKDGKYSTETVDNNGGGGYEVTGTSPYNNAEAVPATPAIDSVTPGSNQISVNVTIAKVLNVYVYAVRQSDNYRVAQLFPSQPIGTNTYVLKQVPKGDYVVQTTTVEVGTGLMSPIDEDDNAGNFWEVTGADLFGPTAAMIGLTGGTGTGSTNGTSDTFEVIAVFDETVLEESSEVGHVDADHVNNKIILGVQGGWYAEYKITFAGSAVGGADIYTFKMQLGGIDIPHSISQVTVNDTLIRTVSSYAYFNVDPSGIFSGLTLPEDLHVLVACSNASEAFNVKEATLSLRRIS